MFKSLVESISLTFNLPVIVSPDLKTNLLSKAGIVTSFMVFMLVKFNPILLLITAKLAVFWISYY